MTYRTEYNELGYIVIPNFLSETEITPIANHVDSIFNSWMNKHKLDVFEQQLVNMHSLTDQEYFEHSKEERINFFNSITPLKLVQLIESIFGEGIYFHNTQLFFNPSNSKARPYWHRDMQYSPIPDELQKTEQRNMVSLHIRIPLVKEKGVEVIPTSHNRWDTELERNVRLELNGHKNYEELPNGKLIELGVGDILIFSAQMIHRGNYKLNNSRKALDICVGKHHQLSSGFIDENVLPTNQEINLIQNNQWYTCAKDYS